MASPITEGTKASSALSSKDINILGEQIHIKISKDFSFAKYTIIYTINNSFRSNKIPLLFLALDYKADFKVWLNNEPVEIKSIPNDYVNIDRSKFRGFSENFKANEGEAERVYVSFENNKVDIYSIEDLKFFETNLATGIHQIKVEYIANVWEDKSDWVKSLSFRYSLSPAKYWKSFNSLSIKIQQEENQEISTNLGTEKEIINQFKYWHFKTLPANFIVIKYKPKQTAFLNILINISPNGFMWLFGVIATLIHLLVLIKNRTSNNKKNKLIVVIGSLIVPFLTMLVYNSSFSFIDNMIGVNASRFHGYYILIFGLYPFVMPIYWLIMHLINRFLIRNELAI
ncbi:hypothetical protein [Pedobacter alpinus]